MNRILGKKLAVVLLAVMFSAFFIGCGEGDKLADTDSLSQAEIDPDIVKQFETEEWVDILIEIKEPDGLREEQFDLQLWQDAVEKAQEDVIGLQDPNNFEVKDQYDSIFMLYVSVNREGFEQLKTTPNVVILSLVKENMSVPDDYEVSSEE